MYHQLTPRDRRWGSFFYLNYRATLWGFQPEVFQDVTRAGKLFIDEITTDTSAESSDENAETADASAASQDGGVGDEQLAREERVSPGGDGMDVDNGEHSEGDRSGGEPDESFESLTHVPVETWRGTMLMKLARAEVILDAVALILA